MTINAYNSCTQEEAVTTKSISDLVPLCSHYRKNRRQKWNSGLQVGMTWWLIMDRLERLLKVARVPKEGLKATIRAIL
jgi:hypothetical protein